MRYATSLIDYVFIVALISRGPSNLATFVAVYALFGPTFPGICDKDRGVYTLFYPGLSFAFPIPSQYTDCCHDREAELPLEFPDGTTPVTCRVSIYDGSADKKVGVGSLMHKASAPPLLPGNLYMEEVHVKLGGELYFSIGGQHIPFGASPQLYRLTKWSFTLLLTLAQGQPFVEITSTITLLVVWISYLMDRPIESRSLFCTPNYPGHADFNSYIKCNFVIQGSDYNSKQSITPSTKWDQVKEILGDCGRAAIQTQGSANNPFGSTFVYGYQNIAFEVMKNDYIATVTLFQS
ncbi:hypothetical protein NC652_018520 [Populus alba x Populus x berolinensis]|nr:hypothetical protein NC652_018520 [Populus alba x Populus x berolinensis]